MRDQCKIQDAALSCLGFKKNEIYQVQDGVEGPPIKEGVKHNGIMACYNIRTDLKELGIN
jgi:hypothetical protein